MPSNTRPLNYEIETAIWSALDKFKSKALDRNRIVEYHYSIPKT
jgi:hypothetical protein